MKVSATNLPGVLVLQPQVFDDGRGFFMESYNQQRFEEALSRPLHFVQDNHSRSEKNVLRGLHYQLPPRAQAKLVRVLSGEVFDVAVDLRPASPTFGHWAGVTLSAENKKQLWLPEGFAHGFLTLSDSAELLYKTSDYYAPEHERCIAWDDPSIAIQWPLAAPPILSAKDRHGLQLGSAIP
jgi:dTDP-4-dehydrorhamnose 3,5-epimerase